MKRPQSQRGLSLIELLVALAIGSILIVGAVYVFSRGRTTYAVNESVARLQENGRYVLSVLEPDIELAGYYGFTNSPDTIRFVSGASPGTVYAVAAQMRERPIPAAAPVAVANLPAGEGGHADLLEAGNLLDSAALHSYVFLRDFFFQKKKKK